MKSTWMGVTALVWAACGLAAQRPFTLQQALSAPYATSLTPAPEGTRFAWVENAEGRHNLWVGGPGEQARQLTHYSEDDGQDISGLAWSPDGASVVFVRGAENGANGRPANPAHLQQATRRELWLQPLAKGAPAVRVDEGQSPVWMRDGKGLLYVRAGQIYLARFGELDLAKNECVIGSGCYLSAGLGGTAQSPAVLQAVFDRGTASQLTLSPDGTQLAFVSHREHDHSYIGVFDLRARVLRFVAPSTGNDFAPAFSPDGKQLAWLREPFTDVPEFAANRVSANPWSIQVADVATGEPRTVFTPEANKPGSVLPHLATGEPRVFWATGGRLVFYSEADGWVHLYALDVWHGGVPELLTPGEFEVEDATLSRDGKSMAYASNQRATDDPKFASAVAMGKVDSGDSERRHLWRLDMTQANPKPQRMTRGVGIETHPQFAADGRALAALVSDARVPMHAAAVGADGRVTDMRAGAVPAEYPGSEFAVPQQVFMLSADKRYKLHGQMFLKSEWQVASDKWQAVTGGHKPKAAADAEPKAKRPAILFFHGGPHREMLLGYPGMDYYSNAYAMNQYLVSRGFIVLSVNYRCGIGYGTEFRQCEHAGADGATEYNDVLGAVAYLRSRPDVDTKHIGVWGGSYGGYLTALALARNSDLFAAGVDFHGVHEWIFEDNRADWLRGSNAERDAIAARAHASSPIANVEHWRSPVLLIHGDNDPDVAYRQTPLLADALRARSLPVEELIFPDEVHDFLLHHDWLKSYEAAAKFFERVLKPEFVQGPPAPPKPIK